MCTTTEKNWKERKIGNCDDPLWWLGNEFQKPFSTRRIFWLTLSVCFCKVLILCILHSTCTPLGTIQEKGIFHKEGERCGDLVSFSMPYG